MEFEPFTLITACKVKQHVFLFDKPLFFAYSNDQILFYHVSFAQSDSAHTPRHCICVYVIFDIHDDDTNNIVIEHKYLQKDSHTLETHNHLVSYITLIVL